MSNRHLRRRHVGEAAEVRQIVELALAGARRVIAAVIDREGVAGRRHDVRLVRDAAAFRDGEAEHCRIELAGASKGIEDPRIARAHGFQHVPPYLDLGGERLRVVVNLARIARAGETKGVGNDYQANYTSTHSGYGLGPE